ncbi:MAG: agmatine deiminase, partial [Bacteroidales bacterium 45-6]
MGKDIIFPAEWHPQSAIQLTWPHENSDWNYLLDEVTACFVEIAKSIIRHQDLIIVCKDSSSVKSRLGDITEYKGKIRLVEIPSNDTWARDHSGISVFIDGEKAVYDFTFNGWGLKFAADLDNQITKKLFDKGIFSEKIGRINKKNFALEGGALESDGKGTLLTTSECLLSPNRNSFLDKGQIEDFLKENLGLDRILWLDHGYLAGDDTDSHIDTLARFCDEHTIAYVKCGDENDEHFNALKAMEEQLKSFVDREGKPYRLIPLPMAETVEMDGERLPATYANFLILNKAVLVPVYGSELDKVAISELQKAFPEKEISGVNCLTLIKQHG